MKKVLDRSMFNNRPKRWIGGPILKYSSKIARTGDTGIGNRVGDAIDKIDKFDLGYDRYKGPVPLNANKGFIREAIMPTRKSGKVATLGSYGLVGYEALKPDVAETKVQESVITDDNNVISSETIKNKNLSTKISDAANKVTTAITGQTNTEKEENFQGGNVLSGDIFATKNEAPDNTAAAAESTDNLNMSGQFSPYLNPSNAGETAELEKIDMTKVIALKEQLKMLLGDTGQRQDNLNMLFQLGSALMTGKTLKGGLAGFFDVAGQAGLTVLPQMLAASERRNARDQELALAAFELVNEQQNKDPAFGEGKGTMIYPHKISYKMNEDGTFFKDENNQFVAIGYTPVGSGFGFSKDLQSKSMMDANASLSAQGLPPLFTLLDAATTGETGAFGAFGVGEFGAESKSGRDEKEKYAAVLERGLPKIAEMLNFVTMYGTDGTFNSDKYIGPTGLFAEKARQVLAPWEQIAAIAPWMGNSEAEVGNSMAKQYAEAFDQLENYWMQNIDSDNGRLVDVFETDKLNTDGTFTDTEGIYAGQTFTYRDEGGNLRTGTTQVGDIYETPLSIRIKIGAQQSPWKEGTVGIMEQYKNQIGMVVARYKQPTGRLLADTISDSKRDVDLTPGFFSNPNDIVNRQFRYFKNFLEDWVRNTRDAGIEVTPELIDKRFGAADGSGGGLALINRAITQYNIWGLLKESQTNTAILPSYGTWIKFPGAVYPGDENGSTLQSIIDGFKEGIEGSAQSGIDMGSGYYDVPDDFDAGEYIDNYFEQLDTLQ